MEIYYNVVRDAEGLKAACAELAGVRSLGFDTETTELDPYKGDLRLLQISTGAKTQVIDLKPFRAKGDVRTLPDLQPLRDLLSDEKVRKIAHNAKFDAKWVRYHLGCELGGVYDTYLASILISAGGGGRGRAVRDCPDPAGRSLEAGVEAAAIAGRAIDRHDRHQRPGRRFGQLPNRWRDGRRDRSECGGGALYRVARGATQGLSDACQEDGGCRRRSVGQRA